jgi:NADPH-dependent curcumin reductase CurA
VVGVQPLHGGVVVNVIESANPKFQEGDYATGILDFCEYLVAPQGQGYSWEFVPASQELEIVDVSQVRPSYYLGVCGKQATKLHKTFSSLLQTHI